MILQLIRDAHLAARKARDQAKLTTLTTLLGEIIALEKKNLRDATDQEVVKVLGKFADNQREMAKVFADRSDADGLAAAGVEIALYESFMPAPVPQLSADALERVVRSIIAEQLAYNGEKPKMAIVISALKLLHAGAYDPKAAAALVKTQLDAIAL